VLAKWRVFQSKLLPLALRYHNDAYVVCGVVRLAVLPSRPERTVVLRPRLPVRVAFDCAIGLIFCFSQRVRFQCSQQTAQYQQA
jgi:hypothetical protein